MNPNREFTLTVLLVFSILHESKSENVVKLKTCKEFSVKSGHDGNPSLEKAQVNWTVPSTLMSTNQASLFRLSYEPLKCNGGKAESIEYPANVARESSKITFYPSGYLLFNENPFAGKFFHTSQYCINGISFATVEILTCKRNCGPKEPCINKCCTPDTVYNVKPSDSPTRQRCVDPGAIKYTPRLFNTPNKQISKKKLANIQPWYSLNPPPNWIHSCPNETLHLLIFDKDVAKKVGNDYHMRHRFLSDGKLILWNHITRKWNTFDEDDNYCVDGILYDKDKSYTNLEKETFIMSCPINLKF